MSRLLLRVLCIILWVPVLGIAQTATQSAAKAGATKLAWVDLEQAIFSCDEGQKEFSDVQKFVDDKNAELESMRKEAESLRNQLSVQGPKLTDEARMDLEDQVDTKNTLLQRFQQDTQKEIDNKRVRATNYLGRRMQQVVEGVAKEKGLTAVFFFNASRDAWFDPSLNITEEVVKAYNQKFPVSSAKAPASAAPAD